MLIPLLIKKRFKSDLIAVTAMIALTVLSFLAIFGSYYLIPDWFIIGTIYLVIFLFYFKSRNFNWKRIRREMDFREYFDLRETYKSVMILFIVDSLLIWSGIMCLFVLGYF